MGFVLTYKRFISVRVKEDVTDLEIRHLSFRPSADCLELFRNHHIVFRARPNGFDTYYRVSELASESLQSPISKRTRFSFSIKVKENRFFDIYDADGTTSPQFYLDNLTNSGLITTASAGHLTSGTSFEDDDTTKVHPQSFVVNTDLSMADPPTEWRIKEKFTPQDVLQTVAIDNPDSLDTISVRMNDPILHSSEFIGEEGPFVLESDKASPAPTSIYLSDFLSKQSINGVLDIYWDSAQTAAPADTGREYQIIFKRK